MTETLVSLEALLPQLGQSSGLLPGVGAVPRGQPETVTGGAFQARLNALLSAAAEGSAAAPGTSVADREDLAGVLPGPGAVQPELLRPAPAPGPGGNILPTSGNLLPPAAAATLAGAPVDGTAQTNPAALDSRAVGLTSVANSSSSSSSNLTPGPRAPLSARRTDSGAVNFASLAVTRSADGAGLQNGPPAATAAAAGSATPELLELATVPAAKSMPAPPAALLAEAQRIVAADADRGVVRPATLLALARSAAPQSARQSEAATAALTAMTEGGAENRGTASRVAAPTELGSVALGLQARPVDAPPLPLPGALESAAADLPKSFAAASELRTPVGASGWSAGLGQRLLAMAENGVDSARLRLHPANLGPLDIQIAVEDDRAQVWFGAQNGTTREALEAALPRLREMFAEQGLELAQADVGQREADAGTRSDDRAAPASPARAGGEPVVQPEVSIAAELYAAGSGSGLDIYV